MKLQLRGAGNNWDIFRSRKRNKKFMEARKKLLKRDNYTCQFCQFRSPENDIINADNNYRHNKAANLVTACSLCAKCNLMDAYSIDYEGKDCMIYLPEVPQFQLNQICHLLFARMQAGGEAAYNAQMIYAQLQDRAQKLNDIVGAGLSHPGMFLHYLNSVNPDRELINRVRWLPNIENYESETQHWAEMLEEAML